MLLTDRGLVLCSQETFMSVGMQGPICIHWFSHQPAKFLEQNNHLSPDDWVLGQHS